MHEMCPHFSVMSRILAKRPQVSKIALCCLLSFSQVMFSHHSEQMSQRSQVSKIALNVSVITMHCLCLSLCRCLVVGQILSPKLNEPQLKVSTHLQINLQPTIVDLCTIKMIKKALNQLKSALIVIKTATPSN